MKYLYLLTALLFATAGNVFAMENAPENFNYANLPVIVPRVIVIRNVNDDRSADHIAMQKIIKTHLGRVEAALKAKDDSANFNVTVNHTAASKAFDKWLNLFDETPKTQAKNFTSDLRKLFIKFQDLNPTQSIDFALNLSIQKTIDKNSDNQPL
jgi:hypothetical protein